MTVYRQNNDAIEGERIVCQYNKNNGEKLIHASEAHRGTQCTIQDAYCVITRPLRTTQYKKK
jgi:hypothetical protein